MVRRTYAKYLTLFLIETSSSSEVIESLILRMVTEKNLKVCFGFMYLARQGSRVVHDEGVSTIECVLRKAFKMIKKQSY